MPNTHRRRRRDETVLSRRRCVLGITRRDKIRNNDTQELGIARDIVRENVGKIYTKKSFGDIS